MRTRRVLSPGGLKSVRAKSKNQKGTWLPYGCVSTLLALSVVAGVGLPVTASGAATSQGGTVTLGLINSLTGKASSAYLDAAVGAQDRINEQNALGGVNGRKIKLAVADDASSPSQNLTAAQTLVQSDNALAVTGFDPFTSGSLPYINQNKIPLVGGNTNQGAEFSDPFYTNLFAVPGSAKPNFPVFTAEGKFLKSHGVTNLATLAYSDATSSYSAKSWAASAQKAGIKVGYTDYNVQFGSVDFTADVLAMKKAGVNGLVAPMAESSDLALLSATRQGGLSMKVAFFTTGYDQATLDSKSAVASGQGADFANFYVSFDGSNAAANHVMSVLHKNGYKGSIPTFGIITGWLAADQFIQGLKLVGSGQLTKSSFISALREDSHYTAGGVLASPEDLTSAGIATGDPNFIGDKCWNVEKLVGHKFQQITHTPQCGKAYPNSQLIKNN
jgi:branched-chain amino acid transport system substrate-binding protein